MKSIKRLLFGCTIGLLLMLVTTSCATYSNSYWGPYFRKVGKFEYRYIKNKPAPRFPPPPGYYRDNRNHNQAEGSQGDGK